MSNKGNRVTPEQWDGYVTGVESSLHQLAPYIGKMKSSMASTLIEEYSTTGDTVVDPFCGSGTIPLEAAISGRRIISADTNPYAVVLTRAKLHSPRSESEAVTALHTYLERVDSSKVDLRTIPKWVRDFFHPRTLKETIALARLLRHNKEYFLFSCLLGILHHQRPGFLSYPASHLVPYLRSKKYPAADFPEMYEYREVGPRLIAKLGRVFKRNADFDRRLLRRCEHTSADRLQLQGSSIDAVITSPPYMNTLDYARDNRLRLWFLGTSIIEPHDERVHSRARFIRLMERTATSIDSYLKKNAPAVFVVGDINYERKTINTLEIVKAIFKSNAPSLRLEGVIEDEIPDVRRSRREGRRTKREWIIVFRKRK